MDIGAGDGVNISNTFILEKNFNWNGIVCDPLPTWHKSLEKNRKCIIDTIGPQKTFEIYQSNQIQKNQISEIPQCLMSDSDKNGATNPAASNKW